MNHFEKFFPAIRSLSAAEVADPAILRKRFSIQQDGDLQVCYAPLEARRTGVKVVIVGITPGMTQMVNALAECRRQLNAGASEEQALLAAKLTGAFSGAMRPNLVAMLDRIGLHSWLGLGSCNALFGSAAHLVQTTSVLQNPVFVNGGNYNGTPNMLKHPMLKEQLLSGFGENTKQWSDAVYVPLGDKVAEALTYLVGLGHIKPEQILEGLPHPSGANSERIAYFLGHKRRAELSAKTNPEKLDVARVRLVSALAFAEERALRAHSTTDERPVMCGTERR